MHPLAYLIGGIFGGLLFACLIGCAFAKLLPDCDADLRDECKAEAGEFQITLEQAEVMASVFGHRWLVFVEADIKEGRFLNWEHALHYAQKVANLRKPTAHDGATHNPPGVACDGRGSN